MTATLLNWLRKNWMFLAVVIFLLLALAKANCERNGYSNDETQQLKDQVEQFRNSARETLKANTDLKKQVAALADSDKVKASQIAVKEAEIGKLKTKLADAKQEAAKDYPKFFFQRYDLPITITPTPAQSLIANDLIEGDIAKEELGLTRQVVILQTERITGKDSIIGKQGQVITNLESAVTDYESALDASDKVVAKVEKDLRNKKIENTIIKVLIPVAFIGGLLAN